ncbi:MAG: sel1 repeat family protein [Gammaproteobacteria bacterium]|nr:sel1 repeat family protein [Gammaproteobacteria bacterium]MCI0591746.1 sel1 repeat family protein [Gammaproteobacteria bacterium]
MVLALQDFDAAVAAYERGDYSQAIRTFWMMAEQGAPVGQFFLGDMYMNGKGVLLDPVEAVKWWRRAAEQGQIHAQYNLGVAYLKGVGVLQDYVQAYAWFNVGAAGGDHTASKSRDIVVDLMTPAEIEEAKRLSCELFETYKEQIGIRH